MLKTKCQVTKRPTYICIVERHMADNTYVRIHAYWAYLAPFYTFSCVWSETLLNYHTEISWQRGNQKSKGLGSMLWFFQYFRRKIQQKHLAFLTQNKAKLCKSFSITLVFVENANFVAENGQKSQKIVIITSTPGLWGRFLKENSFPELAKPGLS
jgi:hypothetical protein